MVDYQEDVLAAVTEKASASVAAAMAVADKTERNERLDSIKAEMTEALVRSADAPGVFADRASEVGRAFRALQKKITRKRIVEEGVRIDGRGPADIRPLSAKVGLLSTATWHLGLFQRGETQVLNVRRWACHG